MPQSRRALRACCFAGASARRLGKDGGDAGDRFPPGVGDANRSAGCPTAIAARTVWQAGCPRPRGRVLTTVGIAVAALLWWDPDLLVEHPWPSLVLLLAACLRRTDICRIRRCGRDVAVDRRQQAGGNPHRDLRASVSPTLPAIPLFTFAGFLLAEGRSSERLLRVFRAWFGWIPRRHGRRLRAALLVLHRFTGGSGVTILALGGLLFPALRRDGYRERFSLGLLTAPARSACCCRPRFRSSSTPSSPSGRSRTCSSAASCRACSDLDGGPGRSRGPHHAECRARRSARRGHAAPLAAKWELVLPVSCSRDLQRPGDAGRSRGARGAMCWSSRSSSTGT